MVAPRTPCRDPHCSTTARAVSPRGLRILSKIPRLPVVTARAVVEQWGSLQGVLGATIEELEAVEGVGAQRARTLRDGLSRLAEISVVERYA